MTKNLFSVPIFFIVFRETIEAAIIVATLLGLAKQIAYDSRGTTYTPPSTDDDSNKERDGVSTIPPAEEHLRMRRLARKLKIQASYPLSSHFKMLIFVQIFAGAAVGIVIALAIGAAYVIPVYGEPDPHSWQVHCCLVHQGQ